MKCRHYIQLFVNFMNGVMSCHLTPMLLGQTCFSIFWLLLDSLLVQADVIQCFGFFAVYYYYYYRLY